jgi:hypothetical protein
VTRRLAASRADSADANSLVCTVGQVSVWPGASNVIAGAVNFTVDVRAPQDALRTGAPLRHWRATPHAPRR